MLAQFKTKSSMFPIIQITGQNGMWKIFVPSAFHV